MQELATLDSLEVLQPPPVEIPQSPAPRRRVNVLFGRHAPALAAVVAVSGEPRGGLGLVVGDLVLDQVPLTRRLFAAFADA